jgi:hypothetical protein
MVMVVVSVLGKVRRRRKEGVLVELVGVKPSLEETRLEEGVLKPAPALPWSLRSCSGAVVLDVDVWKSSWVVRLDCGVVVAKRAVVGVISTANSPAAVAIRRLLGVAAVVVAAETGFAAWFAVDREGVSPRRSKRPSTRPSL